MEGAALELDAVTFRHTVSAPAPFRPWKKRFGPGVFDISLRLQQGQILGLVGPNGAGKTTLLRAIAGVLPIQSGRLIHITPDKRTPLETNELRSIVGHMPEQVRWQGTQSVRDALMELAEMRGIEQKKVDGLLKLVGLSSRMNGPLSGLSQGMRQRLTLAASLLGSPKYLLLDEPLNGLDPVAAAAFVKLLHQLKDKGVSIVISSHQVAGLQEITDCIALMHRGQMLACDRLDVMAESLGLQSKITVTGHGTLPDVSWCTAVLGEPVNKGSSWSVDLVDDGTASIEAFIERGIALQTWTLKHPGIVEMLCAATGMEIDEIGLDIASPSLLPHRRIGGEEE